MGLYEIVCETFENCKELQNLKNLSFNKRKTKNNMHARARARTHTHTHTHKPGR